MAYPADLPSLPDPATRTESDGVTLRSKLSALFSPYKAYVEALGAKVGVTGSADTTSLDYKVARKADLVSNIVPATQLGSGSATSSTYLRGDRTWATVSGGGGGSDTHGGEVIRIADQAGWDPNAADNSAAIQAAIDTAKSGNRGGRIMVPRGGARHASTLNYDDAAGVITEGVSGASALHGDLRYQYSLLYTGTGPTTGIRAKAATGCTWRDMRICYTSNTFTGFLVEYRGGWHTSAGGPDSVGGGDAAYGTFENVTFGGDLGASGNSNNAANLANNARGCLMLQNAICCRILGCTFHYAKDGIVGKVSGYSNMMVVQGGGATNLIDYAIRDTGDSWLIQGFTFEFNADHGASGYYDGQGAFGPTVIDGCWFGDAVGWNLPDAVETERNMRPWVHYRGTSLTMRGNMIASPRGSINNFPGVYLGDAGFNCEGASFIDNRWFAPYPAVQLRGIYRGIQFIGNVGPNAGALIDFNGNPDYGTTYINNSGGSTTPNGFTGPIQFDGGMRSKTNAFPPMDGHFPSTPPDGTFAVDTSNSRIYVRVGGVWKYANLTA